MDSVLYPLGTLFIIYIVRLGQRDEIRDGFITAKKHIKNVKDMKGNIF